MQFSLDRKGRSHEQNQSSASDSVDLIFTRSYRFTLLITTPTTTPSLVKTSLMKLSLRYESCSLPIGWSRLSTNDDMRSVETSLPDMIGLPSCTSSCSSSLTSQAQRS